MNNFQIKMLTIEASHQYCRDNGIVPKDLTDDDYMRIASSIFTVIANELAPKMSNPSLIKNVEIEV